MERRQNKNQLEIIQALTAASEATSAAESPFCICLLISMKPFKEIEDYLKDDKVRIAEVDYDPTSNYQLGHIPGSVLKWKADINNPITRDILSVLDTSFFAD